MKKSILITGVTGIVGSHVFYELLEEMIQDGNTDNIFLLVRSKGELSAYDRVSEEVLTPAVMPSSLRQQDIQTVLERVHVIEGTLDSFILPQHIDNSIEVFHIAASVNLGESEKSFKDIYQNNYLATHTLLRKLRGRIASFHYVSTAFSSGDRTCNISDDYQQYDQFDFRNPYERYKHKMETDLLTLSKRRGFKLTIARPSVVCGRLLNAPHFIMHRYIVFYMIGVFMSKMRKKYGQIEQFRLVANPNSSLNIVPVDYAAKGIVRAARSAENQVNITISDNVPNKYWLNYIMEKEGIENVTYVSEMPEDLNPIERLYYQTVGAQISKYLTSSKHNFDSTKIRQLMPDVQEPNVHQLFPKLYDFACERDFKITA